MVSVEFTNPLNTEFRTAGDLATIILLNCLFVQKGKKAWQEDGRKSPHQKPVHH